MPVSYSVCEKNQIKRKAICKTIKSDFQTYMLWLREELHEEENKEVESILVCFFQVHGSLELMYHGAVIHTTPSHSSITCNHHHNHTQYFSHSTEWKECAAGQQQKFAFIQVKVLTMKHVIMQHYSVNAGAIYMKT